MTWQVKSGALFLFGYINLQWALQQGAQVTRDLDVAELWSGVGNVAAAARSNGHSAAEFDLDRVPGYTNAPGPSNEDITTEAGFLKALSLVLRVRRAGLVWMGPLCSSFVFPDSSHCQRKLSNFDGDATYPPVSRGNLMAVIAVFLVQVALVREVHAAIENPGGSTFWSFIRGYCKLLDVLVFQLTPRCAFDNTPPPKIFKKYKLNGSGPWIRKLQRTCRCPGGQHQQLMHRDERTGSTTGNRALLKASGAYPPRFGVAVIEAWESAGPVSASLQQAAANAEWAPVTRSSANTHAKEQSSRLAVGKQTPEKRTSPWGHQEDSEVHKSLPNKSKRGSPWEEHAEGEDPAPKKTKRPSPWGAEQPAPKHRAWGGVSDAPVKGEPGSAKTHSKKSPTPLPATSRRKGPWD